LKPREKRLDEMAQRMGRKVRDMIEAPSLASKLYSTLPRSSDDQPKQSPIQGWGHLRNANQPKAKERRK